MLELVPSQEALVQDQVHVRLTLGSTPGQDPALDLSGTWRRKLDLKLGTSIVQYDDPIASPEPKHMVDLVYLGLGQMHIITLYVIRIYKETIH